MSHVNAEKTVAAVTSAGTAKMMDSAMGKMVMGPMMGGMGSMMNNGMGPMMKSPGVATGVASGVVASAGASAGKSVIKKIFTHPLVIFGLGVAAGYYLYKYRKPIISASDEAQEE
jgi:hypothetical protein